MEILSNTPSASPDWLELVSKLSPALITLVIGGIGVYIAYQQHKVNKEKFKLDLFDRRMKAFDLFQDFYMRLHGAAQVGEYESRIFWELKNSVRFYR